MHDLHAFVNHHSFSPSNNLSYVMSIVTGKSSWFFHIACCNHMTSDLTLFVSKVLASHIPLIHTIDGSSISITYVGHVSTPKLSNNNTYLIPKVILNLLSVGQLCDISFYVQFSSSSCIIKIHIENRLLGHGVKLDNCLSSFHFKLIFHQ